jgi:DNA polymerase-3 subunit epsilon
MRFVAFDVETANADLASICQLGVVVFEHGQVVETWETLVDPEDDFASTNVSVHGICGRTVKDAPTIPEVIDRLRTLLTDQVVVHHTPFDKISLARVATKHRHEEIRCRWLDSSKVARRAWAEYASKGYGLKNLSRAFGIEFRHHAAGEDARAAGEILLRAIGETGKSLEDWCQLSSARRDYAYDHTRQGNPDGPLSGEVIVFTGSLMMSRSEAADLAARAGCDVGANVTKATTIVVVGGMDIRERADHEKSNKHRKAEELIGKGHALRILAEEDFSRLVDLV